MREYLIDTHIAVWLITDNKLLSENIREDIEYYQHQYHISYFSILEISHLQQLKKINIGSIEIFIKKLENLNISIDLPDKDTFSILEKLPLLKIKNQKHSDMIDRYLVANAITNNYTFVSADLLMPNYRKFGLTLLEN